VRNLGAANTKGGSSYAPALLYAPASCHRKRHPGLPDCCRIPDPLQLRGSPAAEAWAKVTGTIRHSASPNFTSPPRAAHPSR
jgi:hypothetical protein